MSQTTQLPVSLTVNPRLDRWIKFESDRTVRITSGKVEIGQGIVTALTPTLVLPIGAGLVAPPTLENMQRTSRALKENQ